MDEESMWKSLYEKIQQDKEETKHEEDQDVRNAVQEIDGGFFEKFGSLLRQHTVRAALEESTPLAPLPEEAATSRDVAEAEESRTSEEDKEEDSGNETQQDTDSETDQREDQETLLKDAVGWNIDELYEEVVFAVLHNVGCSGTDVAEQIGEQRAEEEQEAQLRHLCDAFRMPQERHEELLANARAKMAPEIRLNVEVVAGKDLHPKDPNGLSDPFVTLFLQSGPAHRYNTSVKAATLNPEWEEHFSLPLDENPQEDVLCLEVWDFDPAETVKEKIGKLFEVRGVKGFRKLMKEIAVTASTGKHDNELIGTAKVPLKSIPATGMTMWYGLDKRNKAKRQGVLKLRVAFSAQKDKRVAAQEHRHLLRILLLHELETSKVADYWWSGTWSSLSQSILIQHRAQGGLSHTANALCEWSVYTRVHATDRPLALDLFNRLLKVLAKPLQQQSAGTQVLEKEEEKMFWEGAVKLLPCCFQIVRRIRKKTAGDQASLKMLKKALQIIQTISSIEPPEGYDLLPARIYGWMKRNEDSKPSWDLRFALTCAVRSGARSWFTRVLDNNSTSMPSSACTSPVPPPMSPDCVVDQELKWNSGTTAEQGEEGLRRMVRLMQLIRSDLQRALEYHDKIFQEIANLPYASVLYKEYEKLLSTIIKPEVETVCRTLHRVRDYRVPGTVTTNVGEYPPKEPTAMGTALFELYLVIKRFVILGQGLGGLSTSEETQEVDNVDGDISTMARHHEWFTAGVAHWLDIAAYKATGRIDKAVELDTFVPVTDDVKYSSSAVDSLAIFYQIKIFWEQLEWPDVEGSYTFVAKIVDDICRCCVFYADQVSARLDSQECAPAGDNGLSTRIGSDACSEKWCVAINNIDYVRRSLEPFVKELGVDGVLERLADYRSPEEAERCRATLLAVIDNNVDTVRNKILELIESLARKMAPALRRALAEGAELGSRCIGGSNGGTQTTECFAYTALLGRLENALATLHRALSSTNFSRARSALWAELSKALFELVQSSLEKRRPPSLYLSLLETLDVLHESFGFGGGASTCTSEPNSRCASPTPVQQQRARLDECREQEALDREQLEQIRDLLKLHALETGDLIHRYHLDRLKEQESMEDAPYGILTVRCKLMDTQLHIEIMSARNLKPMDNNGSCDPFVRVSLLPEDRFLGIPKLKTQSQSKTMFPLFDETFVIPLSEEHLAIDDALISFNVKDKDLFGMSSQYMAEAFMRLSDVPRDSSNDEQTHLKLSRPTAIDSETSKALENRQGDKQAREFLKKLKLKMVT